MEERAKMEVQESHTKSKFGTASSPENCVEYMVFLINDELDSRRVLAGLEAVRKAARQLSDGLTKDYVWQRDSFNLESKSDSGLIYLHGITDHGDSVEDEWLIVYTLRELTKSFKDIWVRVFDGDGEFLLVEAANVAPKWLNPEIDSNRVWIHNGKLFLVPLVEHTGNSRSNSRSIALPEALEFIRSRRDSLVHSTFVESEAFYRLEKYPAQITECLHYSLVTIPRKLAYVLHDRPKAIAPAVEAFYLRDPVSLKPLLSESPALEFPPTDLVTMSVRFTKVLFAQLKSQRFSPPPAWAGLLPSLADKIGKVGEAGTKQSRLETGMKVTSGFELLAAHAHESRNRVVRELGIILDDFREDGPEALPTEAEMQTWKEADREDDEAWLDVNYEDFERELDGRRGVPLDGRGAACGGFGDAKAQEHLRKIVSRFEAFLNDESAGIDGAEMDEMDEDDDDDDDDDDDEEGDNSEDEDKEVSFDEEEFARVMREMMGLPGTDPAAKGKERASASGKAEEEVVDDDDGETGEIKQLADQMEAELKGYGALKLEPTPKNITARNSKAPDSGESSSQNPPKRLETNMEGNYEVNEDEGGDGDIDIDCNLAKNLLESFKGQAGLSGPVGNIMGILGLSLPRDEDDEHEGGEGDENSAHNA